MKTLKTKKYKVLGFFLLILIASPTYGCRGIIVRGCAKACLKSSDNSISLGCSRGSSCRRLPDGPPPRRSSIENPTRDPIPEPRVNSPWEETGPNENGLKKLDEDYKNADLEIFPRSSGGVHASYPELFREAFNSNKKIILNRNLFWDPDIVVPKKVKIYALWSNEITELAHLYDIPVKIARKLAKELQTRAKAGDLLLLTPDDISITSFSQDEFGVLIFNNGSYLRSNSTFINNAENKGFELLTCNSIEFSMNGSLINSNDFIYLDKVFHVLKGKNNQTISKYEFVSDLSSNYEKLLSSERNVKNIIAYGVGFGGITVLVLLASDND